MDSATNLHKFVDGGTEIDAQATEKQKRGARRALYSRWATSVFFDVRGKYVPAGLVIFDMRQNKEYTNYLYEKVNYLSLSTFDLQTVDASIQDASRSRGRALVVIDHHIFDNIKLQGNKAVFLVHEKDKLMLIADGIEMSFNLDHNAKYLQRILWLHYNDFLDGDTTLEEITKKIQEEQSKERQREREAVKFLYLKWKDSGEVKARKTYVPGGPVVFDFRSQKKHFNYLYKNNNYLAFDKPNNDTLFSCFESARNCRGRSLIVIDQLMFEELKLESIGNAVFLVLNKSNITLIAEGFEAIFDLDEDSKYLQRIIWRNFNDLVNGRISIGDVISNSQKIRYFEKEERQHELIEISGNKIQTYLFCQKNKIVSPSMYYIRTGTEVQLDKKGWIDHDDGFVIKSEAGCSAQDVYVLTKDGDQYHDLMHGQRYYRVEIMELLAKLPSVIVEQRLINSTGTIPIDLKVYCMGGKPKYILLINRNHKREFGCVFVIGYDIEKKKFDTNPLKNDRLVLMSSPNETITNELKTSLEDIGINKVATFCNDLLNRLDYREFISLDLFNIDGVLYLGEFTRTPGAFVYHIFDQDSIETIFDFSKEEVH